MQREGLSRENAPSKPIDMGMIARAMNGVRDYLGLSSNNTPGGLDQPFFAPGKPIDPVAQGAAGRRFDYPAAYNIGITPRTYEAVSFDTLRAVSDPTVGGWDLIRLAIETRKDQMSQLVFSVLPRKEANAKMRPKSTPECQTIEEMLRFPDGITPWQQWCSQLIDEHLVIDAASIRRMRAVSGKTIGIELVDGATITPKLNYDGRRPSEGPAFQQILKGFPAVDYSTDELLYAPRNPRVHKVYGFSCVEQVIVTINIGLRRQAGQLAFFTDGNVPEAVVQVPPTWTTAQIAEFQMYWDGVVNDAVSRRKMKFVPNGAVFQMTRPEGSLVDGFDEWLARIVAYCFSLPPTPFVKMTNRATAETQYETALNEGLQPLMVWLKGIIDYILTNWLDQPGLELVWDEIKKSDPKEKEGRDIVKIQQGVISRDDMRADIGLEPLGIGPIVEGIGPLGFMSIEAMKTAIANGWDLNGLPAPAQPALDAAGNPIPGGAIEGVDSGDAGGDPLEGLPPEILEALGLPGKDQPGIAVPAQTNSGGLAGLPHVGSKVPPHLHPDVQAAFRDGHKTAKRLAARIGSTSE